MNPDLQHLGAPDPFYNRPDAYSIRDVNLRLVHQSLYQAIPSDGMRRRKRVDEGVVKRRSGANDSRWKAELRRQDGLPASETLCVKKAFGKPEKIPDGSPPSRG